MLKRRRRRRRRRQGPGAGSRGALLGALPKPRGRGAVAHRLMPGPPSPADEVGLPSAGPVRSRLGAQRERTARRLGDIELGRAVGPLSAMGALTSCWRPEIAPSPSLPFPLQAGEAGRVLRDWGPARHLGTLTLHHQALTPTSSSSETPCSQGTDESPLDSWYPSVHQGSATLGKSEPASLSSPLLLQACS